MNQETDGIFQHNNLTDFEKLLFAKKYIQHLKKALSESEKERGILASEKQEMLDDANNPELTTAILNQKLKGKNQHIQKLNTIISKLRKDNEYLICQMAKKQTYGMV